jgi:hypothetical protein
MLEESRDQLPPRALLLEKDGRFYFFDSGLDTIASGDTLEQAYEKFTKQASIRASDIAQAGVSRSTRPSSGVGRELGLFALKFGLALAILAAIVVPLMVTVAHGIEGAISHAVASVRPISLADIASKAEDIARDAEALPPQKKEALRQSIATIKRELGRAFDSAADPSEPPAAPKP